MCGIAGAFHPQPGLALEATRRMNLAQAHRGPDGEGLASFELSAGKLALGHRRLSIQDTSAAGRQPMTHPESGDVITYNGELYNVVELRADLEAAGARLQSRSDTEVLLHAFSRWGTDCLARLQGMFAFAVYSPRKRTLTLARDPLGIKPLYLARVRGWVAFASEVRALLASGMTSRDLDPWGLASALAYGSVAAPRTMFEGIRLVEPGTFTEISLGDDRLPSRSQVYWRFPAHTMREASVHAMGALLREPLDVAVRSHLISDVPVGIFLSSGIDSTAIVALAARARDGDVDTFTVTLGDDPHLDEGAVAARTAARLRGRHHAVSVSDAQALAMAQAWTGHADQPGLDGLNTFIISRAVRERGIVVALSGLGGDEIFGGYSTFRQLPILHQAMRVARWMPAERRRALATRLAARLGEIRSRKAADLFGTDGSLVDLCLARRRLFSDDDMREFGFDDRQWGEARFLPPEWSAKAWAYPGDDWATVRAIETKLYMSNTLLRDADVYGMAHGLEIRVPLLDTRVLDTALPWSRGLWGAGQRQQKPWLVEALRGELPPQVTRLPKRGFSLPQDRWLRGPLRDQVEAGTRRLAASGHVRPAVVLETWRRFLRGRNGADWSRPWMLWSLASWLDNHLGERPSSEAA